MYFMIVASLSLQSYQNQDQTLLTFFQTLHGFPEDRAFSPGVVRGFHGIAGEVGGGQEIAWFNAGLGGIHVAEDATG
jgi:hypothetical protein